MKVVKNLDTLAAVLKNEYGFDAWDVEQYLDDNKKHIIFPLIPEEVEMEAKFLRKRLQKQMGESMKLDEAKQILKKNGFICESAEFDAYNWLENNYMEMRRAAEANPVVGNSTSIGEIDDFDSKLVAYRIIVPVKAGQKVKWFGIMLKPESENEITMFIYRDRISTRDTKILTGQVTEGVYTETFTDIDWKKIFDAAATIIKEMAGGEDDEA